MNLNQIQNDCFESDFKSKSKIVLLISTPPHHWFLPVVVGADHPRGTRQKHCTATANFKSLRAKGLIAQSP